MWCIMTLHYPLQPPIAGVISIEDEASGGTRKAFSYGNVLFNGEWDHLDVMLRNIVNRCMAHDPADRPTTEYLLQHAQKHAPVVPPPGEDDVRLHSWLQNQILSAPIFQQEIADPLANLNLNKSV